MYVTPHHWGHFLRRNTRPHYCASYIPIAVKEKVLRYYRGLICYLYRLQLQCSNLMCNLCSVQLCCIVLIGLMSSLSTTPDTYLLPCVVPL